MSLCIAKLILAASFVQDQPKDSDVDCSKLRECRLVVTSSAPKLGGSALRQVPAFDQPWIQTCNHLVHVSVMFHEFTVAGKLYESIFSWLQSLKPVDAKLGGFQCSLGAGVAEHPAFGCLETCRNDVGRN